MFTLIYSVILEFSQIDNYYFHDRNIDDGIMDSVDDYDIIHKNFDMIRVNLMSGVNKLSMRFFANPP